MISKTILDQVKLLYKKRSRALNTVMNKYAASFYKPVLSYLKNEWKYCASWQTVCHININITPEYLANFSATNFTDGNVHKQHSYLCGSCFIEYIPET